MTAQHCAHCRIEHHDNGVTRLVLDVADASTNAVSLAVIDDLHAALDEIARGTAGTGLILDSAKPAGFAVGLSAGALGRLDDEDYARALVERGQALTARLAEWPTPTVAILRGTCQNGGLELALATRYRLAEGSATTLGFPEIHLGMHPYWGGTARLGDIIGMTPALELINSGRSLAADEALRLGLIDAVIEATADASAVDEAAREILTRRPPASRPRSWNRLISFGPVRWTMDLVRRADERETVIPASHPATTALHRLWWRHGSESRPRRLVAERESILKLWREPATRNLTRMFLLQEDLRQEGRTGQFEPPGHVHLVGCGVIGTEIATELAMHGIVVSLEDRSAEAVENLRLRAAAMFRERLGDEAAITAAEERLQAAPGSLTDVDLIIEAVPDDLNTKQEVLGRLGADAGADTVIATTTSTLSVELLAGSVPQPGNVVGLHFQIGMTSRSLAPLVEVVRAPGTTDGAIAGARGLIHCVGYLPLVVRDSPGFLVNRLLVPYMLEGARRYSRPQREVIDGAARYVGMRVGPLELADWVGLDRCFVLATALGEREEVEIPAPLRDQIESGRHGCRSGQGFHDWRGFRRVVSTLPPRHEPVHELGPKLVEPFVVEAERCLAEGVVGDEDDLDIGAVVGAGFPAFAGGPLALRRARGAAATGDAERERAWLRRVRGRAGSRR